jgi:O-antigen ligase
MRTPRESSGWKNAGSLQTALTQPAVLAGSRYLPPWWLEYCYYGLMFYAIMGPVLGLSINFLGAVALASLAGFCLLRMGTSAFAIMKGIALPLACATSFLMVQVFAHGQSLMGASNRDFVNWMMGLVIVHYLALGRGLLHRFAIAVSLVGLSTLPYLRTFANDAMRSGLERAITISNPNDLGAWFGFCCVYFTIVGMETRRNWARALAWAIAVGCLLVVGLTVSRAPVFAAACGIVVAFRRVLKRGLFPLLSLTVVAWVAYGIGLFERSTNLYEQRAFVESGRFLVWPLALQRIIDAPLVGVGVNDIGTFVPTAGIVVTPHNGFVFIALAAGIVPLLFFIAYWVQLFATAFTDELRAHEDAPFLISLLVYCFLITANLNQVFTMPYMLATLSTVTGTRFLFDAAKSSLGRDKQRQWFGRARLAMAGRSRA